jgi:hypothetical protein
MVEFLHRLIHLKGSMLTKSLKPISGLFSHSFSMLTKVSLLLELGLNFEADIANSLDNDPSFSLYNLYLEGRNLFDLATIKVGRQSLISSPVGGVYDGASLKLKYSDYEVSGFYGGNVPAYQKLELTDDFSKDYVMGGKLKITPLEHLRFGVSYVDKNFKARSYEAIRLDENFNPITLLIQRNSNQYKFGSADISYEMPELFEVYTKAEFDFNIEELSRIEFSGRYEQIENLGVSIYYNYREPRVRYNSIFSVFNYGNTQEIEAGIDYKLNDLVTLVGKFGNVEYEDDNSQRFSIGANTNFGSFQYRKTFGYAGELDAISLYTAKTFLDGFLTSSAGVGYTSYKLSPDADKNHVTSVLLGVNIKPYKSFSVDLQGQYLNNPIYNNDVRLLLRINHWFNTNLDLL